MTASSWWAGGLFYEIDAPADAVPPPTLQSVAARLDDLRALGVDGLMLSDLSRPANPSENGPARYLNPAWGTLDDFDDLLRQASSHSIRLLVALPPELSEADLESTARFWLNRGVAGLRLPQGRQDPADQEAHLRKLRAIASSYVGERIVIGDFQSTAASSPRVSRSKVTEAPELGVLRLSFSPVAVGALRNTLQEGSAPQDGGSQPLLEADSVPPQLFRIASAVVLGGPDAALLHDSQSPAKKDPPPAAPPAATAASDAIASWNRQVSVLHHSTPALRHGSALTLDHDDQNVLAWIIKPRQGGASSPPVIFVCNLSDKPVQLSLRPDMQRLHLRGSFLRTLLRSDNAMGPMNLDSVSVQPYGVYIGELRF